MSRIRQAACAAALLSSNASAEGNVVTRNPATLKSRAMAWFIPGLSSTTTMFDRWSGISLLPYAEQSSDVCAPEENSGALSRVRTKRVNCHLVQRRLPFGAGGCERGHVCSKKLGRALTDQSAAARGGDCV